MFYDYPEIGFEDLGREPVADYPIAPIVSEPVTATAPAPIVSEPVAAPIAPIVSEPVISEPVRFVPVDPYENVILQPVVSEPVAAPAPIEPTPTVSDPADWQYAAAMPVDDSPVESELPWHSLPEDPLPVFSPTIVSNPIEPVSSPTVEPVSNTPTIEPVSPLRLPPTLDTRRYIEPTPIAYEVPIELDPVYPTGPISSPVSNEPMYYDKDPVCNCITYPCDCDGGTITAVPYEPTPIYTKAIEPILNPTAPAPIVDLPINTTAAPSLPVDVPVTQLPPTVDPVTGQVQDAPGNGDAADGGPSTVMIFGFPWYYVAGAAAALFLLSSSDG